MEPNNSGNGSGLVRMEVAAAWLGVIHQQES